MNRRMEHHVYFWLKPETATPEQRAEFETGLAALFDIPDVAGGCWAVPAATPERPVTDSSWDYALSMRFDSIGRHDAYQVHPEHDAFVERFKQLWSRVEVRDLQPPA